MPPPSSKSAARSVMNPKELEVRCPCCASRLLVETATGKILRTTPAGDAAQAAPAVDRWESAQHRVRERTNTGTEKLESALEAERTKEARFDEMFKKAREKHSKPDDE